MMMMRCVCVCAEKTNCHGLVDEVDIGGVPGLGSHLRAVQFVLCKSCLDGVGGGQRDHVGRAGTRPGEAAGEAVLPLALVSGVGVAGGASRSRNTSGTMLAKLSIAAALS